MPLSHLGTLTGLVRGLQTFYFLTSLSLDFPSWGLPTPSFQGMLPLAFLTSDSLFPSHWSLRQLPIERHFPWCSSASPISSFLQRQSWVCFPPGSAQKHLTLAPYYPARHRTWAVPSTTPPPPEGSRATLLLSV